MPSSKSLKSDIVSIFIFLFSLAKEKAPTIIFIDELDAIGTKRFDSEKAGDREVQRTMLELLNQLDGFEPNTDIKGILPLLTDISYPGSYVIHSAFE